MKKFKILTRTTAISNLAIDEIEKGLTRWETKLRRSYPKRFRNIETA